MTNHTPLLLITGAAGKTGLAAIRRLSELGASRPRVRALARNARQTPVLEGAGAHETLVGDLSDPGTIARALEHVDSVYHICPNLHPEEAAIGRRIIALAEAAGVNRLVYHSVLQPGIRAMPHHWQKMAVEDLLARSDLDFTVLQPAPYMQNILGQWSSIVEQGVYRVPYDLATRVSMVDLDDVARAAARVLTSPRHSTATYELCAPGLLDQNEIATALGRGLGRNVRAACVDRKKWAAQAKATGMADQQIEILLAMFRYYERLGMAGPADPLEGLLRRRPTTLEQFIDRTIKTRA